MSFILLFVVITQLKCNNECLCSTIDCPAMLLFASSVLICTFRLDECSKDAID